MTREQLLNKYAKDGEVKQREIAEAWDAGYSAAIEDAVGTVIEEQHEWADNDRGTNAYYSLTKATQAIRALDRSTP